MKLLTPRGNQDNNSLIRLLLKRGEMLLLVERRCGKGRLARSEQGGGSVKKGNTRRCKIKGGWERLVVI